MAEETCSGRVVSAQANFVRVQVLSQGAEDQKVKERLSLLCTVRQLLKKTQQTIMVGDFVTVSGIDWVEVLVIFVTRARSPPAHCGTSWSSLCVLCAFSVFFFGGEGPRGADAWRGHGQAAEKVRREPRSPSRKCGCFAHCVCAGSPCDGHQPAVAIFGRGCFFLSVVRV